MATDGDSSLVHPWARSREAVLRKVKEDGSLLVNASAALKDDREIVLEAVKQTRYALEYASDALQDDVELKQLASK